VDGKNFAVSADKRDAYIGNPAISLRVTELDSGDSFTIDNWNDGRARSGKIAAFTEVGGSVERPEGGCAARLLPATPMGWSGQQSGVRRDYTVDAVDCGADPLARQNGIVIEAQSGSPGGNRIRALTRGETVRVTWSLGWRGVLETIGGSPVLIENGNIKVKACSEYLCHRHPRTAVGITGNGKIVFFQVDGRSSGSIGLTLVGLAREMKRRGIEWALNLDGGGSSTMWIRGRGVVNRPSDGSERSVANALLVLPRSDDGDPQGLLAPEPAGLEEAESAEPAADSVLQQQRAEEASSLDPGSTGGLLDYVAHEHGADTLGASLEPALRRFRAARA
jgi:hypothetical protein